MALVDHERVLARLKAELVQKPSWGQRDLLALLVRLEVECAVEENGSDRLWRHYAAEMEELFFDRINEGRRAASSRPAGTEAVPEPPDHDPQEASWNSRRSNGRTRTPSPVLS